MAKVGAKLALNEQKIKALFSIIINSAPTPKYVAYGLGIQKPETIKQWINAGEILQEQFEDELDELGNIFPFQYEPIFESRKQEYDNEFKILYDIGEQDQIPDRLKLTYENWILKEKQMFIENHIARKEKDILSKVQLVEDEQIDNEYKLLIQFSRIFHRAKCVVEMGLLSSINKHSKTAKNVQLGYKLLQTYNKEDFAETQTVNHTGSVEVNNKSILSLALNWEKQQRQSLEAKENNLIDITPQALIETAKKDEN